MARFKYPKLVFLLLTFVAAYFIFRIVNNSYLEEYIISLGYLGSFLNGILFSYGFTAAPATAIFLIMAKSQNIFLSAVIGGIGAVIGNLIIFHVVHYSFRSEINKLEHEKAMQAIEHIIPRGWQHHIIPILAGFIMASPLPDELAITMFAASKHASPRIFSVLSFILHFIGIVVIMSIGVSI